MWRKVLGGFVVIVAIIVVVAYLALVPSEAVRSPPERIAEPKLVPIDVPFTHRWSKRSSHPLLAAAAIDIDGDGRDEVFLGGSDGQPDAPRLEGWQVDQYRRRSRPRR